MARLLNLCILHHRLQLLGLVCTVYCASSAQQFAVDAADDIV